MPVLRSTDRCTSLCSYPCAKDHRTRREKIEAMATGPGTTEGERANARKMLGKSPAPKPKGVPVYPHHSQRGPLNSTAAAADAYERVRQRMANTTTAELFREFIRTTSTAANSTTHNSIFGDMSRFAEATRVDRSQEALCKLKGHDWVEIGHSMLNNPISRCVRCGVYDPPRKETRNGP